MRCRPFAYNRFVKLTGRLLLAAACFLLACGKDIQSKEAVRQGIIEHLSLRSGLDLASMDIQVVSAQFRENEADAVVDFRPKGSTDPASGMQMRYTLERKGNRWVVKSKTEAGPGPHGGAGGQLPSGHPPVGQTPPPGSEK